ncbi:MAG: DUF167 domain-containing protein [Planctomycetota bacterium]|nr:DUF167 domain-containing protein [Planctomycetota bacterium]
MNAGDPSAMRHGLEPLAGGVRCALTIRAQPGARRSGFAGFWNGFVKVAVSAPPEDGRANDALREEVARIAGVRASAVVLVSGATSREKRFEIDAPEATVRARIEALPTPDDKGANPA